MEDDNKTLYSYGDYKFDLNTLINTANNNMLSYVKYKGWNTNNANAFYDAVSHIVAGARAGLVSTDYIGRVSGKYPDTNAESGMADIVTSAPTYTTKKGTKVKNEDIAGMSQRKQSRLRPGFDAAKEAAKYWQTIVQAVANNDYDTRKKTSDEEAEKNKPTVFNLKTNGLWNGFMTSLVPASGNVEDLDWNWLWGLDPYSKEYKTRSTVARTKLLSDYLDRYIKEFEGKNYDFTGSSVSRDDYLKNLLALRAALNGENGQAGQLDENEMGMLLAVGAPANEYRKVFMTSEKWAEPGATKEKEDTTKEEEEKLKKQQQEFIRGALRSYEAQGQRDEHIASAPVTFSVTGDTPGERLTDWYDKLRQDRTASISHISNLFQQMDTWGQSSFTGEGIANYIGQFLDLYEAANPGSVISVKSGPYAGYKYLQGTLNHQDWSVLAYNPSTRKLTRIFYPRTDINALNYALNEIETNKGSDEWWDEFDRSIQTHQGGGTMTPEEAYNVLTDTSNSFRKSADETYNDKSLRRWGHQPTDYNNTGIYLGFNFADLARLGSLATDILSILSPESTSSFLLGLAGDAGNFAADRAEGYTWGQSLSHLGIGLATSAVAAIPIVGGALGKTGRVVKGFAKLAPKLANAMGVIGGIGVLANSGEIVKSIGKLTSTDPNDKMTAGDWRNILIGIEAVLGITGQFKYRKAANSTLDKAKTGEVLVKVRDKNKPDNTGLMSIGGDDGVRLKFAADNGDVKEVNQILNNYNKGKFELDTENKSVRKPGEHFWQRGPFGKQELVPTVREGSVYENLNFNKKSIETIPAYANPKSKRFYRPGAGYTEPSIIGKKTPVKAKKTTTTKKKPAIKAGSLPADQLKAYEDAAKAAKKVYEMENPGVPLTKESHAHTSSFEKLVQHYKGTKTEKELIDAGYWKKGGSIDRVRRVISKAAAGESLSFSQGSLESRTSENTEKGLGKKIIKAQDGKKITGLSDEDWNTFSGWLSEYMEGTTPASELMANSSNALRVGTQLQRFTEENPVNYKNLRESVEKTRGFYWDEGNAASRRASDFVNYARNWYQNNPDKGLEDLLSAYNNDIASMYKYRYGRKDDQDWYTSTGAREFNQAHRRVYSGLNDKDWLGYNEDLEDWYGSTTAIRPIDITQEDVDLDLSSIKFGEGEEGLKNLLTGLKKAKNGMYYSLTAPVETPVTGNDAEGGGANNDNGNKKGELPPPGHGTGNETPLPNLPVDRKFNTSQLNSLVPDILSVRRFLGSLATNRAMYNTTKKMPITLYPPTEAHRWVLGDQAAIQRGYNAAGALNHMASTPITSDAAQQTAAQFAAYGQGQDYINEGYAQNDKNITDTREKSWTQEQANRESRYDAANKNRQNLALHRETVLNADAVRRNTDYNSWSNLLSGVEQRMREASDKNKQLADAYAEANQQNGILKQLVDGLTNETDKNFINGVIIGSTDLDAGTEEQQKLYYKIMWKVQEQMAKWRAARAGVQYTPYIPGTVYARQSFFSPIVTTENAPGGQGQSTGEYPVKIRRHGGSLGKDSEKVAIQKLRGRVQKMQIFQKHLEARMNACEKAVERSQRSASQYWKGMTK